MTYDVCNLSYEFGPVMTALPVLTRIPGRTFYGIEKEKSDMVYLNNQMIYHTHITTSITKTHTSGSACLSSSRFRPPAADIAPSTPPPPRQA